MTEDLTHEIDAGLAKMEALIAKMRGKIAPDTAKRTRMAFQACVSDLEDSQDPDAEEAPKPVVKLPEPTPALRPTTYLRRVAGA